MANRLIEIFRAGDFTTATGKKVSYTQADIDEIFENYDPAWHRAAFTTDHKQDGPAWGYVKKLIKKGASLFASADDIHESLSQTLGKNFGRVSVEIWPKLEGKGKYLKAVSFLGVKPPAVKGLEIFEQPEELENEAAETVELSYQPDPTTGEEAELILFEMPAAEPAKAEEDEEEDIFRQLEDARARLNELQHSFEQMDTRRAEAEARLDELRLASRKNEFEQYLNEKIAWGSLPPALMDKVMSLLIALENVEMFSEDGTEIAGPQAVMDIIDGFEQVIKPGKHIATAPKSKPVTKDHRALAAEALEFQQSEKAAGRHISISDAVRKVSTKAEA